CDNLANGSPAQAARAKGKRFEETVVQLIPGTGVDQFFNAGPVDLRTALRQKVGNVFRTGRKKLSCGYRSLKTIVQGRICCHGLAAEFRGKSTENPAFKPVGTTGLAFGRVRPHA